VLGNHRNTIEITKDSGISLRADCIIGVAANKACSDLNSKLIEHIRSRGILKFVITVKNLKFVFSGSGSSELQLTHPTEIVFRKSDFISSRTIALHCDAAAIDLPREMIKLLQDPNTIGSLRVDALPEWTSTNQDVPRIEFI
jgi:hypothetical protein